MNKGPMWIAVQTQGMAEVCKLKPDGITYERVSTTSRIADAIDMVGALNDREDLRTQDAEDAAVEQESRRVGSLTEDELNSE